MEINHLEKLKNANLTLAIAITDYLREESIDVENPKIIGYFVQHPKYEKVYRIQDVHSFVTKILLLYLGKTNSLFVNKLKKFCTTLNNTYQLIGGEEMLDDSAIKSNQPPTGSSPGLNRGPKNGLSMS